MKWFLHQEVAGEAGFDDLVALTQLRMPERAKLELARNYWDEMGRGKQSAMHGPMLSRLAHDLELQRIDAPIVWESRALGNMLAGLAANRCYAYQSVGALGVVELTAPDRAALVNAALKRLGCDASVRQYYALHATLDVKHSEAWNGEVLRPLVEQQPHVAIRIAEGALMRLTAGARCFERYRRELRVRPSSYAA
ncbi:MAG: iron-containing redox enzyme family protein [Kofleriaceae bacterium]